MQSLLDEIAGGVWLIEESQRELSCTASEEQTLAISALAAGTLPREVRQTDFVQSLTTQAYNIYALS